MAALLIVTLVLVVVLVLYGRAVVGMVRHAFRELVRYLTLVIGVVFIVAMLILLTILS